VSRLLAPLAVFAGVLAAMVALNHGAATPPAPAAGRAGTDYAALGNTYLTRARETGDPAFYSRAERAFDVALRKDPASVDALVGAGTLAGFRHDFREQLRLGEEARRVAPQLARPLPVMADAQIELGRYRDAARTIQRLVDLKPGLAAYARVSYYRELHGDMGGALRAMRFAVSAGGDAAGSSYVETLLGDLELMRGRVPAARTAYREALRDVHDFPQALTGLARIDAASGRLRRAAARLRRSTDELPLTTALTLLAEVEAAIGNERAARADLAAARVQHRLLRRSRTLPDAEAVLFEANHGSPAGAVRLGRRVWRLAPSIRSADAFGWALTRAGRPAAGLRWARRTLRTGSADPQFSLHAGVAALRSGRRSEAERYLTTAVKGAAALSPAARRLLEEARS
jgi:tetratricopeptide (TPR) repeat protein